MAEAKTITDIKSSFLRSQVRLLSAPLQVSSTWQSQLPTLPENTSTLPTSTTEEIVAKVNKKVQSHNRLVFSSQSQRHVAEQVDALYWRDILASHEAGFVSDPEASVVRRDTDLCEQDAVKRLPEDYDELHVNSGYVQNEEESKRYHELRQRLADLSEKRHQLQQKLDKYRKLQQLMQPLEHAQENVQPNLVTKDGDLSKEMDRMRILLARIGGRIGEIEQRPKQRAMQDFAMPEDQKLASLLNVR